MRTVTFKSVYERVMRMVGLDPDTTGITAGQKAHIVDLINDRVRQGWEFDLWPELVTVESRPYRETWSATETYVTGDEVYYATDGKYYEALADTTGEAPSSSPAAWSEVSGLDPYYPFEPADATAIGEMLGIYRSDPRANADSVVSLAYTVDGTGIWVHDSLRGGQTNWIKYRRRPPMFTLVAWSAGGSYTLGDVVYVASTGECYQAALSSAGAEVWVKLDMPYILQDFVVRAAAADYLREQGNEDRAEREEAAALRKLVEQHDKTFLQQGQAMRMAIRVE